MEGERVASEAPIDPHRRLIVTKPVYMNSTSRVHRTAKLPLLKADTGG